MYNLVISASLLVGPVIATPVQNDDDVRQAPKQWTRPGTAWIVHVKRYTATWVWAAMMAIEPEPQPPLLAYEFDMIVTVLPTIQRDGVTIARLQFTPEKAPARVRGHKCILELNAETSQVIDLRFLGGRQSTGTIHTCGRLKVLTLWDSLGFPCDWMVQDRDALAIPRRKVTRTEQEIFKPNEVKFLFQIDKRFEPVCVPRLDGKGKQRAVQIEMVTHSDNGSHSRKVIQTWVPGEPCWRTFQRYDEGKYLELEASFVKMKDRANGHEGGQKSPPADQPKAPRPKNADEEKPRAKEADKDPKAPAPLLERWQSAEVVEFKDFDDLQVKLDGKLSRAFLVGLRPIRETVEGKEQQERVRRLILGQLKKSELFAQIVTREGKTLGLSLDAFAHRKHGFTHPWRPIKYPYCWTGWGAYNFNTYFLYTKATTFKDNFGNNKVWRKNFSQAIKEMQSSKESK